MKKLLKNRRGQAMTEHRHSVLIAFKLAICRTFDVKQVVRRHRATRRYSAQFNRQARMATLRQLQELNQAAINPTPSIRCRSNLTFRACMARRFIQATSGWRSGLQNYTDDVSAQRSQARGSRPRQVPKPASSGKPESTGTHKFSPLRLWTCAGLSQAARRFQSSLDIHHPGGVKPQCAPGNAAIIFRPAHTQVNGWRGKLCNRV